MPRSPRNACAALAVALVAGCSATSSSPPAPTPAVAPPSASSAPSVAPRPTGLSVAHPTVWVCRPGMRANPCAGGLGAVVVHPDGTTARQPFRPAAHPAIDCFYVYPTVSRATTANAPLHADAQIVATTRAQAARFASVCRLFVPVYRQATVGALTSGRFFDAHVRAVAAADIRSAWHDYLRHDNHGRGVVLIGHSQGAMVLTRLIESEIDNNPAERRLLVSALLLGGDVTTAVGRNTGGSFLHLPQCVHPGETTCVVAYSSFPSSPPPLAFFGRTLAAGQHVICTDPTRLAGGAGALHPYFPTVRLSPSGGLGLGVPEPAGSTAGFVTYPGYLTGRCRTAADATFLDVNAAPADGRAVLKEDLGPAWGLHVADVNLALGDLVHVVRLQAAAWSARH